MKDWPNMGRIVSILKVVNGYIVKMGCQQFVFKDEDVMFIALESYLKNPTETERKWLEQYGQERKDKIAQGDCCVEAEPNQAGSSVGL